MAYLRILTAGVFTFFICFGARAQFENELGAGFGNATAEEVRIQCAVIAKKALSFGGAAVEFAAECAQKIGSNLISGLAGGAQAAAASGMAVAKCIWSPINCASDFVDSTRAFIDLMSQAVDKVGAMLSNIEPRQAAMLACEMIGSSVAHGAMRGGIPGILANLSLKLAKFASLGTGALALQKLGVAAEVILNIDQLVFKQIEKMGAAAKAVFAREVKMCSI